MKNPFKVVRYGWLRSHHHRCRRLACADVPMTGEISAWCNAPVHSRHAAFFNFSRIATSLRRKIMKTACLLFLVLTGAHALAQSPTPQYGIRRDQPPTGSHLRPYEVQPFSIPLNLTYAQLSAEDRQKVHANYEAIAPGDEPPFPADGLVAVLNPIRKAQAKWLVKGQLTLLATVDGTGKVTEVSALKSPDPTMTNFAAQVLMLTPFKPAVCSGKPCQMQFPLSVTFTVN
jgi:hypothetical protein